MGKPAYNHLCDYRNSENFHVQEFLLEMFCIDIFSWAGVYTLDESVPFNFGKPSLRCMYRSRVIMAALSCLHCRIFSICG